MKKLFSLVTLASVLFLTACQKESPNPVKSPKKGPSTSSARTATHVSPVNYLDHKGKLIVVAGDNLYAVDPNTFGVQHLATGFSGTEVLTYVNDDLVYTQSDHLNRYNPFTGALALFGSGWYGTEHMTTIGGAAIAIHQGTMYIIDHSNGNATYWGDGWGSTVDLATTVSGTSGRVFGIQGGNEWQLRTGTPPTLLTNRAIHGSTIAYIIRYEQSTGISSAYYVDGNRLRTYNVFGSNSPSITTLGTTDWSGTTAMNSVGGNIWILKSGIIYKVSPTTGQILGTVNIPGAYIIESYTCRC